MNDRYPWHASVLKHIHTQLVENRQPHAMLFRWRLDYGDSVLGWRIAEHILCDKQVACGACKHCRLLTEGTHPNLLFLDVMNDKVGIEQIRALEQQMWQTSLFDKPKIAYIQGVDSLSEGAQNALLKTLEEPPHNALFILSVQNISRVLPTIISRVQRLHHGKIADDVLLQWLQQHSCTSVAQTVVASTAKLADFAPLRALALLGADDAVRQLQQEKSQFADFISGKNSASVLASHLDKEQAPAQLARFCRYTQSMIHVLFERSTSDNSELAYKRANNHHENSVQYATWKGVSLQDLYRLHDALMALRRLADTNVNLQLQFITSLTDWQHERK